MASLGAKVLQTRSVELAMAKKVPLRVLSSFIEPDDHGVLPDKGGTLICDEEEIVEKRIVSGVTMSRDEARITLLGLGDRTDAPAGRGRCQCRHDRPEPVANRGRGQFDLHDR